MGGRFALLPNARSALAEASRPPAVDGTRLRLSYAVQIQANGSPVPGTVPVEGELRGPGDVVGLDRRVIGRVEPEPGLRGFEPNYLPSMEFIDADLPWRYSLDTATASRVRPWVVLIALKPEELEYVPQGRGPLPRIRVLSPAGSLPDLGQSWAYAHVQVDLSEDGAGVEEVVASDPSAHFSRLLCPRHLEERTQYHLFLVPAFEAGRLTGLGGTETASPFDAPAWDAMATDPVELPLYFQSRFTTNELEDVETLVRRLRGLDADDTGAGTTIRASAAEPGHYDGYAKPGETFEVQAALRRPGEPVEPYRTDGRLAKLLKATLEEVIAGEQVGPGEDGPDVEDPLVAMPPYGWRFRPEATLSPRQAGRGGT